MMNHRPLRILPASDRALLVEYEHLDAVLEHFSALKAAPLLGVRELIPAARTLMVRYNPLLTSPHVLAEQIRGVNGQAQKELSLAPVFVDVVYNGEDLKDVAQDLHVSIEEFIARHTRATWTGAFSGFAPGFVYCVGDDPLFDIPRHTTPRTRIPAGSVAVASNFSAIYPRVSPGGWQLIGHTNEAMWNLERETPSAIVPGQQVIYRSVREQTSLVPQKRVPDHRQSETQELNTVEIIRTGSQLLLQDLGRPGLTHMGVPSSGAADRQSLRNANRLVGNASASAALEITGGGTKIRLHARTVIALVGATAESHIETAEKELRILKHNEPTPVELGDTIHVGGFIDGMRAYLAVRGGFNMDPVLGSLATDTLSNIGPDPLQAGDRLHLRTDGYSGLVQLPDSVHKTAFSTGTVGHHPSQEPAAEELRIILGPRTDWFTDDAVTSLVNQKWQVTSQSNRVGLRLQGDSPLERAVTLELPSEAAETGAIQVPPDGQPVLFLPDHPLTGGYPIIGTVIDKDLDRAGQLTPGTNVTFRAIKPFAEY